jgi:hypothetical protein
METRRNKVVRWSWTPIPALLLTMVGLWIVNPAISFESNFLILVLNFFFSTLASLYIAYLIGRSFLVRGSPGLLLLGCGVLTWGAAGVVANAASQGNPNVDVTVHNLGVALSALCHLAGAALLRFRRDLRTGRPWLSAGYVSGLGAVGVLALLARDEYTPTFFVPGEGGTLLRQCMLGSSTGVPLHPRTAVGQGMVLIAVTGWGHDQNRRRSHEAGFDHHLVKPVDPHALMQLLAGLSAAAGK